MLAAVLFSSWPFLCVGLALALFIFAVALLRRIELNHTSKLLIAVGVLLLALAAGDPSWDRPAVGTVAVMVDLSPSTRGATYRDRAALDARVRQLLGDTQYRTVAFADANHPLPPGAMLPEWSCDRTVFTPSDAGAVLLFSDGQFELPDRSPPTYPVIDPALDRPPDAAVARLNESGGRVTAELRNGGTPRTLHWSGASAPDTTITSDELRTVTAAGTVTASLSPGDRWPENDALSIRPAPPPTAQRWWVGSAPPDPTWTAMSTTALSTDPAAYLAAGVIVLDNVSADALSTEQQRRLTQYVRDLGGGLVIGGGEHAFAAGHYGATPLDALSPLASDPPEPANRWVILVDGSGSMAGDDAGTSPWQREAAAVARVLPQLPPADRVRLGSFAQTVTWWTGDVAAKEAAAGPLTPPDVLPTGPTNLESALDQVAGETDGSLAVQLLLITDADAALVDPSRLAAAFAQKHVHLHVLATGDGPALPLLRRLAGDSDGSVVEERDPASWVGAAERLARATRPARWVQQPATVRAVPPYPMSAATVAAWNRAWLKPDATLLADNAVAPMVARWSAGAGRITAVAYRADAAALARLAADVAAEPTDPRFHVTWDAGSSLRVAVDADDGHAYLNGLQLQVTCADAQTLAPLSSRLIPQTGPGTYEQTVPTAREPMIVSVTQGPRRLARFAVAGRYPPEFDGIGNDRVKLDELARRTGGAVISPGPARQIDFRWPTRRTPLISELASAAFACIAAGLVHWKRRGG